MSDQVTLFAALIAGVLSFISPCVLPLIPGYVSFVSGVSLEEMRGGSAASDASRRQVLLTSLAFVAGFSLVFIALGASASAVGKFLFARLPLLERIAGAVIIVFGLHTMGVFRIAALETEKRVQTQKRPAGPLGAVLVGIAFAFGWTPCIGPILGSILAVAATREGMADGIALLAVYSAGLGIPFLIAALGVGAFTRFLQRFRRSMRYVEIAIGLLLVATGVAMATGALQTTGTVLFQWFPWMQEIG